MREQKHDRNYANQYSASLNSYKGDMMNKNSDGVFEGGMLPETVVFGNLDEKDKWKIDNSRGDTYKDIDGELHPWSRSVGGYKYNPQINKNERWFDTRTKVEKNLDSAQKSMDNAIGLFASPITGYINMGSNASKIVTGGGQNKWSYNMADPRNQNRLKAAELLGTDLALMAVSGGIPGTGLLKNSVSKIARGPGMNFARKYSTKLAGRYGKAVTDMAEKSIGRYATSKIGNTWRYLKNSNKNPLGVGVANWVEDRADTFLRNDTSGKWGTTVHNIAHELADFNSGVTGAAQEVVSNYIDDSIKNPIKARFSRGGVLYRKFDSGGPISGYDAGHYTEPDRRGNKYRPGVNNIHQGYEYVMGKEYGEGFDMDKLYKYFAAIAAHEGKGNVFMRQDGGGPGRGVFQIEDNKNGADYKARYTKFLRAYRLKTPEWFAKWDNTNASNLGKGEQLELLMAYNFYGDNRQNLYKYLRGDITAGELAAINHKRTFKEKGKVGEVGYMTEDQMRKKYVDDINGEFNKNTNERINNLLFDNDFKLPYKHIEPDNTTMLTKPRSFGYRCGDGKCALNDMNSGPITEEERDKRDKFAEYNTKHNYDSVPKQNHMMPGYMHNGGLLYKK